MSGGSQVILIDQTLIEGLRLQLSPLKLQHMAQHLGEIGISTADIGLTDWERYGSSASSVLCREKLRVRVRAYSHEVRKACRYGFTRITFSYRQRSGKCLGKNITDALLEARRAGAVTAVQLENASILSMEDIRVFRQELIDYGVQTLIYSDGDSRLEPFLTYDALSKLNDGTLELEFHAHNARGLATANSMAALQAGVKKVAVSVCGIGGNGHAAVEELIMGEKHFLGRTIGLQATLAHSCQQVLTYLGLETPVGKAIVGSNIFAHESGIHVDGVIKDPEIYEIFRPEEVGLSRLLIIGKHSGTAALKAKFRTWGVVLDELKAQYLLEEVRKLAVYQKCQVDDNQLKQLYFNKLENCL